MIPTKNTPTPNIVKTVGNERGTDDDYFNLWDWYDAQGIAHGAASVKPVGVSDSVGAEAIKLHVPVATTVRGSWTAESVLAAIKDWNWPKWVKGFRPEQLQATAETLNLYERGISTVMLDAPTGSGKTLIGEMARVAQKVKGVYVCSGLELQDQFMRDFDGYAQVLKGRGNYATVNMPYPAYSCADCTKEAGDVNSCTFCPDSRDCPYVQAKDRAMGGILAVLNTTYFLYEANHGRQFSGQKFVVVDECDELEGELMRFVEFRMGEKQLRDCGVEPLKKGVHRETIKGWVDGALVPGLEQRHKELRRNGDDKSKSAAIGVKQLLGQAKRVSRSVLDKNWVRDYEKDRQGRVTEAFVMRPITVGEEGAGALWKHGERWLLMSATIISPEQMVKDLGIGGKRGERGGWEVVTVPMSFPVSNRPVVVRGVAALTRKTEVVERPKLAVGIGKLLDIHSGDNVLVHTHSYALTRWLVDEMGNHTQSGRFITYNTARERSSALARFKTKGGIIFGPSLDRGVDLSGDLCRAVIIAKVPYANLGDKQVSERSHMADGNLWYAVQTIRTLVQMTGRGVRHKEDWAVTYILDKMFSKLWKNNRALFPEWWQDGVGEGLNGKWGKMVREMNL